MRGGRAYAAGILVMSMIVGGCAFVPQRIALLGKQGPARSMCAPGLRVAAYPEMTIKDDSLHEQPNAVEKVRIVGAVVEREGKVLLVQRLKRSRGYYEFPGGKVEGDESDELALVRELNEELSVQGTLLSTEPVAVGTDGPVELTCYRASIEGEVADDDDLSVHWVEKEKLTTLAVPPADHVIIEALTKDAQ